MSSCWKSAGILLLEVFLRVDTQSQVCLQATADLLGFEHYLSLCIRVFGISYVSVRCQLVEVYLSENSASLKICSILPAQLSSVVTYAYYAQCCDPL